MTRGVRISNDLRMAIINMHSLKVPTETISRYTGKSKRTIRHIVAEFNKHGYIPSSSDKSGRPRKLTDDDIRYMLAVLQRTPDMQLTDLQRHLFTDRNLTVALSTIWRGLQHAGWTMRCLTKAARERNWSKRARYLQEISQYLPHELVFLDESSFDRRTCNRRRAWGQRGTRTVMRVHFLRGVRYSVLPAMSLNGILHMSVVGGSFNMATFNTFVQGLAQRMRAYDANTHPPNSVIVLDNCRIHKDPGILEFLRERGIRCVFLPPYSPDYNPIELAFSSMKHLFRKNREEVNRVWNDEREAKRLLIQIVCTVNEAKAAGWFRKCGYDNV